MASPSNDSDGTRQPTSPATPIASRLVANSVSFSAAPSSADDQRRACIQQMLAVVQHHQHLTVGDKPGERVHRGAARLIG